MANKAKQEASGTNLTHAQLADLYSSKVSVSSGEKVNRDYVGAAVYVYKYILSDVKSRGNRGLLDIILFKMDMKDWLTVQMDACQLSAKCKSAIRASMSDFAAFHQSNEDCSWRAPLLPSASKFAELLEA